MKILRIACNNTSKTGRLLADDQSSCEGVLPDHRVVINNDNIIKVITKRANALIFSSARNPDADYHGGK